MIKKKKILKHINSEFNLFFLEQEFKKNKLNRIYYLMLFLIQYIKKISQLFKYKYIINLYLNTFFYKKFDVLKKKKRAFVFFKFFKSFKYFKYIKYKKKTKKFNILFNFLFKKKLYNLNSFIFYKISSFYKLKSFFFSINNEIKKNFFLFKFFILLNLNQLSSFIRIKRFKVFLLLLHFLFNIRKKGWKWKYYYYYTIKFIKKKKFKKAFYLITSSIEKKIMYFLYFKLKTKNQTFRVLNINSFILHLFLKTNYNLNFFDLKKFYYQIYTKWYVSSLEDLILLLERKIDIVLNKFVYNFNINLLINTILINDNSITSDYIINIGDFITIEKNIYFNKWFYFFFFLKDSYTTYLSFFLKKKIIKSFFNIFFETQFFFISSTVIVYNFNLFFWTDISKFLLKCINLFYIFFYLERFNIFFFEFVIDVSFFYFENIESYLNFSKNIKHKFFIFIYTYYIFNFVIINTSFYIYLLKYLFYKLLFFLKLIKFFFLFSFFNNIRYNYSKSYLLNFNFMYNILNSYDFYSYLYFNSNSLKKKKLYNSFFYTIDFYSINFDKFFYSFIKYKNTIDSSYNNKTKTFKSLYENYNFNFLFSIGSTFDYKIGLTVIKLIHFYLIDSFNFNVYTDWILNKNNIYFIYNIKKQLYLMKYNNFIIQKKIYSFLNISIENFF